MNYPKPKKKAATLQATVKSEMKSGKSYQSALESSLKLAKQAKLKKKKK